MARPNTSRRSRQELDQDYDEFHESLAAPASRPYYDPDPIREYSPVEQFVGIVAGILNLALALRFVLALFTSDTSNPFVAVLFGTTDWLVAPFQSLFGAAMPSGGGGYFDLPALAAIAVVWILAWIINLIARGPSTDTQV